MTQHQRGSGSSCSFCGTSSETAGPLFSGREDSSSTVICGGCIQELDCRLYDYRNQQKSITGQIRNFPSARQLVAALDRRVVGQSAAKRKLAVAVTHHIHRVLDSERRTAGVVPGHSTDTSELADVVLGKSNLLLVGPTGSGKTLLVESLAETLQLPVVIVDATTLTQAGYVGEDVESVIARLFRAAGSDVAATQRGIIYIDEIDKIGRVPEITRSGRDPSGEGVQQALLKIVEGTICTISSQFGQAGPRDEVVEIDTSNILFIAGGAFTGLEAVIARRLGRDSLGFRTSHHDPPVCDVNLLRHVCPEDLLQMGMIPELVGRFPVVATLDELSVDALVEILTRPRDALLRQYRKLCSFHGVGLEFTDDAVRELAQRAAAQGLGARGLRSLVDEVLEGLLFDLSDVEPGTRYVVSSRTIRGESPLEVWRAAPNENQIRSRAGGRQGGDSVAEA